MPKTYTAEEKEAIFVKFIDAVEDGDSVREALAAAGCSWGGLSKWLVESAEMAARYAHARTMSAASFAERALDVANAATPADAAVARLRVDTLKWRAAMADPKGYGERRQVDTNVTVTGTLHLDALRRVGATASAKLLPHHDIDAIASRDASSVESGDSGATLLAPIDGGEGEE